MHEKFLDSFTRATVRRMQSEETTDFHELCSSAPRTRDFVAAAEYLSLLRIVEIDSACARQPRSKGHRRALGAVKARSASKDYVDARPELATNCPSR